MRLLIILATGLFTLSIFAQDVAPITLADELSKLGGQAELLRHDLPSITCREEATSQLIKKSKISQEVRFVAEVRLQRGNHDLLAESYNFEQLNGSPYSGPEPRTPFFVEGAVNEGMLFFLPAAQPFFTFTLSPGRLDFKASPGVSGQSPFGIPPSTHGFALLDRSGNVTQLSAGRTPKRPPRCV